MKHPIIKLLVLALILIHSTISFAQTNLLDNSNWTSGVMPPTGYTIISTPQENAMEMGLNPHNVSVPLWTMIANTTGAIDGGFYSNFVSNIDHTKTYRFTVWVKKINSFDGRTFFAGRAYDNSGAAATLSFNGNSLGNNYVFAADVPELNKWFLIVGYLHHSGYSDSTSLGGVYSKETGNKVISRNGHKLSVQATQLKILGELYQTETSSDRQYFWDPRIEEVNGQEPTIAELINPNSTPIDTTSPSIPSGLTSSNITTTTATLSWSASTDNIGVTAYEVYKNNSLQATVSNGTSYAITGLAAATAYTYTIKAKDAAGNVSAQSSPLTLTTLSSGGTPATGGHWSKTGTIVSYAGGKVGIGTANPDYELTVKGKIHAEEVKIDLSVPAPDYVFKKEYKLLTLEEVQAYINKNGHLPNIPSAKVMETEGVALGAMEMKLLEKIEELTLYSIALLKQNNKQQQEIDAIKKEVLNIKINKQK